MPNPLISDDVVVLAILLSILFFVFRTSNSQGGLWSKFYKIFPPILLCYFLPGLLNSLGIISGQESQLYPVISKYLLPPCLILFTLSLDISMLKKLGTKALLVFLAGTVGVVIGGPIAVLIVKSIFPATFSGENAEAWRGLSTVAGSWIGGGANQTALKEIFQPSAKLFSQSVAVDIIVAETWLAILLVGVANKVKINKWLKADTRLVDDIKQKMQQKADDLLQRNISFYELIKVLFVGFSVTGVAYLLAGQIVPFIEQNYPHLSQFSLTSTFFWVVILCTTTAIILSQTKLSEIQDRGANEVATVFLYLLIAAIGMQMDLGAIAENPALILVGVIWIIIHAGIILLVGKLLKAPFFFIAVGSQANVGGAASASVVAAAYHPSLISVGVILSVLGYTIGTYAGYITTILIKWASF
ncbi:Uncharacterized membrane protein [Spirosomataceae bacterium TFI 002]|nr:Uncharacterized membrane protein [Spirosomataceae bacterium TFI 002]